MLKVLRRAVFILELIRYYSMKFFSGFSKIKRTFYKLEGY